MRHPGRPIDAWRGLGALLLFALNASVAAQPADLAVAGSGARGLIVKLKQAPERAVAEALRPGAIGTADATGADPLQRVLASAGVSPMHVRSVGRASRLLDFGHTLGAIEARQLIERLQRDPEVQWVVANERERRLLVPGDVYFSDQWWLQPVRGSNANVIADRLRGVPGLQSAWSLTQGSADAVVAVLDTGITSHPDLAAHVLPGYDFVSEGEYAGDGDGRDADPSDPGDWVSQADKTANPALFGSCDIDDSSWHGTVIAGIVAAVTDNGEGVAGINWNGRVLPVRVAGRCGATLADIIDGMRWAAGLSVAGAPPNLHPARIVNLSFGGSSACNAAYQDTIDELAGHGVVVVAAAGNEHGTVTRPASCAGVVGVAALNRDGFKASYSNFGPQVVVSTVGGDPGSEGAWGPWLGDDGMLTLGNDGLRGPDNPIYPQVAGTSFASPVVAGVISLMLSANPGLTVGQLIDGLRKGARPHVVAAAMSSCSAQNPGRCVCSTQTCGAGIVDAVQAVLYALDPAGYAPPAQLPAQLANADIDAAVAQGADRPPNAALGGDAAGGGGALGLAWLLTLVASTLALRRCRAP